MSTKKKPGERIRAPKTPVGFLDLWLSLLGANQLTTAHTSHLCNASPAVREPCFEIRQLEHHTQAEFSQLLLILINEVQDLFFCTRLKLLLVQHAVFNDLFNAQHLLTLGVNGKVKIVTA